MGWAARAKVGAGNPTRADRKSLDQMELISPDRRRVLAVKLSDRVYQIDRHGAYRRVHPVAEIKGGQA